MSIFGLKAQYTSAQVNVPKGQRPGKNKTISKFYIGLSARQWHNSDLYPKVSPFHGFPVGLKYKRLSARRLISSIHQINPHQYHHRTTNFVEGQYFTQNKDRENSGKYRLAKHTCRSYCRSDMSEGMIYGKPPENLWNNAQRT
jgi:hypothetical protein